MKHLLKSLLVLLVFCQLTGCAVFREGELGEIGTWPPEKEQARTIAMVITGKAEVNGSPVDVNQQMLNNWQTTVMSTYERSGLFTNISRGTSGADLLAEVSVKDKAHVNIPLAFLTGFTLYLIPSRSQDTFVVKTTFRDASGNVLGTVERQETMVLWQQLFLVFGAQATLSGNSSTDILSDVVKATLVEARQKKII